MRYASSGVGETQRIATDFARSVSKKGPQSSGATIIGLYGDLGSGKTTFVQNVGKALGIGENMMSPTFVIEKVYKMGKGKFEHLIHIDAYRLEKAEELAHLGWQELVRDQGNLILIEWSERVSEIMPEDHIRISFEFIDEHTRAIGFENYEI